MLKLTLLDLYLVITYETLVNMKKKNLLSKLKLQKTTIASLKTMRSIKGGTLQTSDTSPAPMTDLCLTHTDCPTQNGQFTCDTTHSDTLQCPRPTQTGTSGATDSAFCSKANCTNDNFLLTRDCV